jgi:hypothetical protein
MLSINKWLTLREAKRLHRSLLQIDKEFKMKSFGAWDSDIKNSLDIWCRHADSLIVNIYGAHSDLQGRMQLCSSASASQRMQEYWRILSDLSTGIKKLGLPATFKTPTRNRIIEGVVLLSVGSILTIVVGWIKSPVKNQPVDRDQNARQAAILAVDFQNWLRDDNITFPKKVDSITDDAVRRYMFASGEYFTYMVNFAREYRMRRDGTIDSFLVRFRALGVNTDTMKVSRRLPIRMDKVLRSRYKDMRVDGSFESYRLDTL